MLVGNCRGNFFTNYCVSLFRSNAPCLEAGCSKVSGKFMGHEVCATHCKCLTSDLVYDPFLCDSCVSFFKRNFEHATDEGVIRTASDELVRHIRSWEVCFRP